MLPNASRGELGVLAIDDDADGYRTCWCSAAVVVLESPGSSGSGRGGGGRRASKPAGAGVEEEEVVAVLVLLGPTLGECRCVESMEMEMVGRDMPG